jgi:hypothetical protein
MPPPGALHPGGPRAAGRRLSLELELAFLMGLHPRLGAGSPAGRLVDAAARLVLDACAVPVPRRIEL